MLRLIGSLQRMMQGLNLKDYIRLLRSDMTLEMCQHPWLQLSFLKAAWCWPFRLFLPCKSVSCRAWWAFRRQSGSFPPVFSPFFVFFPPLADIFCPLFVPLLEQKGIKKLLFYLYFADYFIRLLIHSLILLIQFLSSPHSYIFLIVNFQYSSFVLWFLLRELKNCNFE